MSKVKIGKDVRWLILLFANVVSTIFLWNFSLNLSVKNIVKNVYDLMIRCEKISTISVYTRTNDYVLISLFPPQSSPNLKRSTVSVRKEIY
jgi:hypothetical protein